MLYVTRSGRSVSTFYVVVVYAPQASPRLRREIYRRIGAKRARPRLAGYRSMAAKNDYLVWVVV